VALGAGWQSSRRGGGTEEQEGEGVEAAGDGRERAAIRARRERGSGREKAME
jgi:hypothetical protein